MIDLTGDMLWKPEVMTEPDISVEEYNKLDANDIVCFARQIKARVPKPDSEKYAKYLLNPSKTILGTAFEATTQLGKLSNRFPLQPHIKSRNP